MKQRDLHFCVRKFNFSTIAVAILCLILCFTLFACNKEDTAPTVTEVNLLDLDLRLIVPDAWELEIGDSRSVDYAFKDGITNRSLSWTTGDSGVATVDKWGRVTAVAAGLTTVTATTTDGLTHTVNLNVVSTSANTATSLKKVNYSGNAVTLGDNLQKIVTRYPAASVAASAVIPEAVKTVAASGNGDAYQTANTPDGAVWTITSYGVLRTFAAASDERDKEQRFMGDRYFYSADTSTGKITAIYPDETTGIWTVMPAGVTHIEMKVLSGTDKAAMMVEDTQNYVMRHGYVAESYYQGGDASNGDNWKGNESDNDGLWTSMYAAGELMRYASLKNDPTASAAEIAAAKRSAWISTEAVLLLSNISMRTGTVEAYIRYQPNGRFDKNPYGNETANGRYYSQDALEKDGDGSINAPNLSPAAAFEKAYNALLNDGEYVYALDKDYLDPFDEESWSNPIENEDGSVTYETRTRNLEGFIARTYSFDDENNPVDGYIHWDMQDDGTAIGVSSKNGDSKGYYLNGENLRGVTVTADGDFPTRLWNDLKNAGEISGDETIDELTYKGDTSSDEIIGHLFLYKLAYDIIGAEDAELKSIISGTMERFAQHVSDNGYMMVDASGQPGTWSKFNRYFFYNSSQLGGAPLTAAVALCIFKVAYYVTGNEKWENEYRMAALDPSYEYAKLMTQYSEQCYLYFLLILKQYGLDNIIDVPEFGTEKANMLTRIFLNYSDEEMAMLAFYILFQTETDEVLLNYYRAAIDDWWMSIKYSENPLWYYIYQLSRPNETVCDAYGNNILETAAWSLSRHPVDTTQYLASNANRDDVSIMTGEALGGHELSYSIKDGDVLASTDKSGLLSSINITLKYADQIEWAVAAPDERALHKYNGCSYRLDTDHNIYCKEGSTTYTLPYWMGIYHGMLKDVE